MMMDIFSSFDPFIYSMPKISSALFWMISLIICISLPASLFMSPPSSSFSLFMLVDIMFLQTSRTKGSSLKSFMTLIPALFIMIILLNLLGLMPYIFSSTSHLILTLSLGLPMWMSLFVSSFTHNWQTSTANLLPGGAPDWLNPFLVIIETLSTLVRPLTLSFRLAANMTAGHVVLALMSSYLISSLCLNPLSLTSMITFMVGVGYILFEVGICLIQAYIFCLLITLYSDDHS